MSVSDQEWPVKVHLVQDDTRQPNAKPRQVVSILNSYPMNANATPVQIAPDAPNRKRLTILVNNTGANAAVVAVGNSQSDVQSAMANAVGEFTGGVCYIQGPNTVVDLSGTTALWAGLIVAGTNACVLSTIQEIETC